MILQRLFKPEESQRHLQRALEIDPTYHAARDNLAQALLQINRPSDAAALLETGLESRPKDPIAQNNVGIILVRLGRLESAEAHFRKAVELQPDYALAHHNLGGVLLDERKLSESAEHSQRALILQPGLLPAIENLLDATRLLATHPDSSIRDGDRAIEFALFLDRITATNNPVAISTLAAAYAETGRFDDATAEARRALKLASVQTNAPLVADLEIQLSLYRTGKPYRATTNAARVIVSPERH